MIAFTKNNGSKLRRNFVRLVTFFGKMHFQILNGMDAVLTETNIVDDKFWRDWMVPKLIAPKLEFWSFWSISWSFFCAENAFCKLQFQRPHFVKFDPKDDHTIALLEGCSSFGGFQEWNCYGRRISRSSEFDCEFLSSFLHRTPLRLLVEWVLRAKKLMKMMIKSQINRYK